MYSSRSPYSRIIRFAVMFFLLFSATSCEKPSNPKTSFACKDQTVTVQLKDQAGNEVGTIPKAVYLCEGYKLTWDPNGNDFKIKFRKNRSPFSDGDQDFDTNKHTSKGAKHTDQDVDVYDYDIWINGQKVDDPQVVIGGGHS